MPVAKDGTYTGEELDVTNTPHDFRSGAKLGERIHAIAQVQSDWPHGDAYLTGNMNKLADYENMEVKLAGGTRFRKMCG